MSQVQDNAELVNAPAKVSHVAIVGGAGFLEIGRAHV